ncbi:MAG: molybdenum cofactor biosynthesis protein B [Ketobacter sp.]|nr:molybdenum cofactor biosynthesis protein B [Ketobacter sp.]RLT94431.1 MAG: molybdenum cofactor biosynthesis protein B [Ketobacter sp.]
MTAAAEFIPVKVAVLTVSDTRTEATDTSGNLLVESVTGAGHEVTDKQISLDDVYQIRAIVSGWIASPEVEAILITGGTGFSGRDTTPEAVAPLFDKQIEGFGEVFRHISFNEIGTSTVQSRALGGLANNTVIFCMPGSTNACRTAWNGIIQQQLDATHKPCNFVKLITERRLSVDACETRG